jgi:glycosyltransferase involved in cell wall biosynthesis
MGRDHSKPRYDSLVVEPARIVVIIPARNEQDAIGKVLSEIPPVVSEVIVVDNGSTDATSERARVAGARVVSEARPGYGRACLAGIAAAGEPDVLVFLDGDGSDYPEQLGALVEPIVAREADLVIGSRNLGSRAPGAQPWHAVLGTRVCVALMNLLIGTRATDLGPFRAVSTQALRRLGMRDTDFGWTVEMQLLAHRCGLRVREMPVDYRPRLGRSKISGTIGGSLRAGVKILSTILRHALGRR